VCNGCLHPFHSKAVLDRHTPECMRNPPQAMKYLDPEDCTLKFQAHKKQFRLLFYLICDFESFLFPADEDEYYDRATRLIDEHRVCGFARHGVTYIVEYKTDPIAYSGLDPCPYFTITSWPRVKLSAKFLKNKRTCFHSQMNNKQSTMRQHTVRPVVQILELKP